MSGGPTNRTETESCKLRASHLHYAIDASKIQACEPVLKGSISNEHRILLYNPVCKKIHSRTASKTFIPGIVIFMEPVKPLLTARKPLT